MMPFVTYQALRDALRALVIDIRENVIPQFIARIAPRTTIASASTSDSGRNALVDELRSFVSGIDGQGTTQVGRAELAGHLVVPRNNEPAQVIGDLRNSSYLPLGSPKYRPTGGKPGDAAQYNLTDEESQRASVWIRETGKVEANSGTGAGQDVVVNGGTHKVARIADRGDPGRLQAVTVSLGGGVTQLLIQYQPPTNPDGGPTPPTQTLFSLTITPSTGGTVVVVGNPPGIQDIQLDNYNIEGAEHFKA
jgi:hypothetical protein